MFWLARKQLQLRGRNHFKSNVVGATFIVIYRVWPPLSKCFGLPIRSRSVVEIFPLKFCFGLGIRKDLTRKNSTVPVTILCFDSLKIKLSNWNVHLSYYDESLMRVTLGFFVSFSRNDPSLGVFMISHCKSWTRPSRERIWIKLSMQPTRLKMEQTLQGFAMISGL